MRAVPQRFEWLATLDGSTNAEIRPQVSGTIESVNYQEGTTVAVGALLFTLDRRPFQAAVTRARGDYETAGAQLDKARADVARYTPLVAERALSRQELDNARAAAAVASASVQAMQGALAAARLNLEWAEVRSPIDGLAGIAKTRVGNLVNSTQVLTVVSTLDPIRATVSISEREYLGAADVLNNANRPEYAASRVLELVLIDGRVHPYKARRVIVNRQLDPTTGTLQLQALFENPGNILRPGMFARLRLITQRTARALLIPERAVELLQGQSLVRVIDDQGRVAVRRVGLGRLVDHEYIVNEGLDPGARVIVEGLQNAQPGARVAVREAPSADEQTRAPADGGADAARGADAGAR